MAAVAIGVPVDITLAAARAVTTLTGLQQARYLILWTSDVAVDIVTSSAGTAVADGRNVPVASMVGGYVIDISCYGFIGLAGATAGTVRVEAR